MPEIKDDFRGLWLRAGAIKAKYTMPELSGTFSGVVREPTLIGSMTKYHMSTMYTAFKDLDLQRYLEIFDNWLITTIGRNYR